MIWLSIACFLNACGLVYMIYRNLVHQTSSIQLKQMLSDVQKVTISVQTCRYEIAEDRVNSFSQFTKLFDIHRDLKVTVRELYEKVLEWEDAEWLTMLAGKRQKIQQAKERAVK